MDNPVIPSPKSTGEKVLRTLFRILIPEEIDFLCQMTDGMPKVPLTILVEKELKTQAHRVSKINQGAEEAKKAKILPFNSSSVSEPTSQVAYTETQALISNTEEVLPVLVEENLEGSDLIFRKEQVIVDKKIDRVKFVLEQRNKFRKHYLNLKKNEIYVLYGKESEVPISAKQEQDVGQKANLISDNKGILVNKKCS